MVKKFLGVIMAITCMVTMAGTVGAASLSEPVFGAAQMVKNGSFETVTEGVPANWTATNWEGLLAEEGENHYLAPTTQGAAAEQLVTGLEDYTMYECTFRMRSTAKNTPLIKVKYQHDDTFIDTYYTDNGITKPVNTNYTNNTEYSFTYSSGTGSTTWRDMRFIFYMPIHANAAKISFGCQKDDTALAFDDISIRKSNTMNTGGSFDEMEATLVAANGTKARVPFNWFTFNDAKVINEGFDGTTGRKVAGNAKLSAGTQFPARAGEKYKLSFRYKVEVIDETALTDGKLTGNAGLSLQAQSGTTKTTGQVKAANIPSVGEWHEVETNFTPTLADGTDYIECSLTFSRSGTADANLVFYYDDLKLEYAADEVTFYNNDTVTDTLPASGETLKAELTHYTRGVESGTAMLFLCVYEKKSNVKKLVGFALSDSQTIISGANDFSASLTMPTLDEDATYYACAYVWKGAGSLTPLAEKFILNRETK